MKTQFMEKTFLVSTINLHTFILPIEVQMFLISKELFVIRNILSKYMAINGLIKCNLQFFNH